MSSVAARAGSLSHAARLTPPEPFDSSEPLSLKPRPDLPVTRWSHQREAGLSAGGRADPRPPQNSTFSGCLDPGRTIEQAWGSCLTHSSTSRVAHGICSAILWYRYRL